MDSNPDKSIDEPRLDRSHLSVKQLTAPNDSLEYWLSRPVVERLQALERLRRICYGADYDREGFQIILEVTQLDQLK